MRFSKFKLGLVTVAIMASMITGCGKASDNKTEATTAVTTEVTTEAATEATKTDVDSAKESKATKSDSDKIASADEMVSPEDIVDSNMVPITGDMIKDGEYDIEVDSSSSMFNITACKLTVSEGKMTAVMTMGGTGYKYIYMGTGEDAVKADESEYINYEEVDGVHTYTVPVEALDKGIDCTAFSKKKEKWYDRIIVFKADKIPDDCLSSEAIVSLADLNLEDGEYKIDVKLAGGSGKTSIETPVKLIVEGDSAKAVIIFSSKNYDYVIVDGTKYLNENEGGNSTFTIPVLGFNYKMPIIGDTTAMSTPHEIDYTLYFDKDSIEK